MISTGRSKSHTLLECRWQQSRWSFSNRVVSTSSDNDWPPRFPDHSVNDLFFIVYSFRNINIFDLKRQIGEEINTIFHLIHWVRQCKISKID